MSQNITGLVTFSGYQTKYKLDDEFWKMISNKPRKLVITNIHLVITKDSTEVRYYALADFPCTENSYVECELDKLSRTKEELCKNVFD